MRSGAFRRLNTAALVVLTATFVLGGCASAAKKQYLRHLSVTIDPASAGESTMQRSPTVAAVKTGNQPHP